MTTPKSECTTDWNLCVLCQKTNSDPLIDPSKARNKSQPSGHKTLANNLAELDKLGALPLLIDISRLDDGSGLEETLLKNTAKWHKECYVLCNKQKVE